MRDAGRRADVELDLAAVDQRKEVATDEHEQRAAQRQHQHGGGRNDETPIKQAVSSPT